MKMNIPEECNSDLLFLVWYLLTGNHRQIVSPRGEPFFLFQGFKWLKSESELSRKFTHNKLIPMLISLCRSYHVIRSFFIGVRNEAGRITFSQCYDDRFRDLWDVFDVGQNLDASINEDTVIWYSIDLDEEVAKHFIEKYLQAWQGDDLYSPEHNFLTSKNQVKEVVKEILRLIKMYPTKNLWVQELSNWFNLDFVAVVLFMEKSKIIELKASSGVKYDCDRFKFMINLTDLFNEFFLKGESTPQVEARTVNKDTAVNSDEEISVIECNPKNFEVWLKESPNLKWQLQYKSGAFKKNGRTLNTMMNSAGKPCIPKRDDMKNLKSSLATAFNVSPGSIEKIFFFDAKANKWGIKESAFKRT